MLCANSDVTLNSVDCMQQENSIFHHLRFAAPEFDLDFRLFPFPFQQPQYQQPIYVASNQNPMMNQMASQQQQQQQQIPVPPIMPNGAGAAIYATATCSPNTSSSVNPTIYAGQQHMMLPPGGGLPGPGQQQQLPNNYGQTNGGSAYGGQPQYGIPPVSVVGCVRRGNCVFSFL